MWQDLEWLQREARRHSSRSSPTLFAFVSFFPLMSPQLSSLKRSGLIFVSEVMVLLKI